MSDAAYADDGGDAYEADNDTGDGGSNGAEGGDDGQQQERQARAPLSPQELEKRYHNARGAVAKERSLRRELESRLSALESKQATEPDPLDAIAANLRDDDMDPMADLEGLKRLGKALLAQQAAERQQTQTQTAEQRKMATLSAQVKEHEDDFRVDNPDYDDAFKHMVTTRSDELAETGLSGAELNDALRKELLDTVTRALASGRDPAATIYAVAKKRGFGVDSATKKLQTIQSSQLAGRSLSEAGVRNGGGGVTAQAVIAAKGEAKLKAFAKFREQALRDERRA